MDPSFKLIPPSASEYAPQLDLLFYFICLVMAGFTLIVFLAALFLGLKYRRRPGVVPQVVATDKRLELAWSVIPFIVLMAIFAWGAALYVRGTAAPDGAMEVYVTGKQWMWYVQHPTGRKEINELHVPVGRPVKLLMISQDVIHSFFIPAFRMKQDVLPGRYTQQWFTPTKPGEYHLFCTEYCGAEHSGMVGRVVVLEPEEYDAWLGGRPADVAPAASGERLFTAQACITCHGVRAPSLAGVAGAPRRLADGSTVTADDDYLRESILYPHVKVVAGYPPIMPSYAGSLSEDQVRDLIAYIKTLSSAAQEPVATPPGR